MHEKTPDVKSKAEALAQSAFWLGAASIFCGITALPAIIQSIRALIQIQKEEASKAIRNKVVFSLVFSCLMCFVMFMFYGAYSAAKSMAREINCVNKLKEIYLGIRLYEGDNGDKLPPINQWGDAIQPEYATNTSFQCPESPRKQRCGYALNNQLNNIKHRENIPTNTVLLFESDGGWNATGGPETVAARHYGYAHVVLMDGSIETVKMEDVGKLHWDPSTNSMPVSAPTR